MNIRNWFLTLTTLSFLLLALVLSGIWYLSQRIDLFYQVGERRFNANILVQELRGSSEELTRQVRIFAVSGSPEAEKFYWSVVSTRNGESPRPSSSLIAPGQKRVLRDLLMENGITPEEYAKVEEANRLSDALVVLETEAMNAVKGLFKDDKGAFTLHREPDMAYATQLVYSDDYANSVAAIMRPMDDFTRMVADRNGSLYKKTIEEAALAEQLLYIAVVLTLLMMGVVGWYSTRKVAKPLDVTAAFAQAVSSGDLQSSIDDSGNNEIFTLRKSLNHLVSNLRQRITEAEQTSAQARGKEEEARKAMEQARDALHAIELSSKRSEGVALNLETLMTQAQHASHELAQHINAAGIGSEQQAQRVTETATAMEKMNSTTMIVASNARDAVSMSMQAQEKAKEGSKDMGILVRQIGQMQEQTISMTNDMHELSRNADGITQVMTVISDIADQTNLLALNAAIEAARAGEAGRGFAVVADEVRKLAEKTMQATGEVGNTIKGIQAGTHKNVHNMSQSVESIENATKMAKASGSKLEEIVHLVEEATGQVQLITEAAVQQQQASEEITKAIVTVQDISQGTLDNMRRATGNVDAMNQQISDLHNLTDQLRQK